MLPWHRNLSTLARCRNFSSLDLGIIVVLDTKQRISTIFYASMVQDPFHTSMMQELLLFCSWNHYGSRYPTTEQHNLSCFCCVGPYPQFHSGRTSGLLFQESLWWLIPKNELAQSFMLPLYRTLSTPSLCRNFSSVVLGIILVLDTQQWINTSLLCFHSVGPIPHIHGVGNSHLLFQKSLWCLIRNNGLTQSFIFPQCRTLSTLLQCGNFSSSSLGLILVLDSRKQVCTIFFASKKWEPLHTCMVYELLHSCSRNHCGA